MFLLPNFEKNPNMKLFLSNTFRLVLIPIQPTTKAPH